LLRACDNQKDQGGGGQRIRHISFRGRLTTGEGDFRSATLSIIGSDTVGGPTDDTRIKVHCLGAGLGTGCRVRIAGALDPGANGDFYVYKVDTVGDYYVLFGSTSGGTFGAGDALQKHNINEIVSWLIRRFKAASRFLASNRHWRAL
jgi:hypothetical protein